MIKGEKVGLRAVEKTDLALLRDWRNNSDFRRNFREHKELGLFNQEKWFEKTMCSTSDYMFIIERLEDNLPIGACGLLYVHWITRTADFSFYIGHENKYIDNEYAPEAIELLLKYGFENLNLNKIWMELYEFDSLKLKIFEEKFGFKIDGKLRQNCFQDGQYWDSYIISLLQSEFQGE
jgi:RimJ/RimL family protein N-acetyltransferase